MSNSERDPDLEKVKQAVQTLREHFDSVQIFTTRYEFDNETSHIAYGEGDYYARYGKVKQWVIEEEETRSRVVRSVNL